MVTSAASLSEAADSANKTRQHAQVVTVSTDHEPDSLQQALPRLIAVSANLATPEPNSLANAAELGVRFVDAIFELLPEYLE